MIKTYILDRFIYVFADGSLHVLQFVRISIVVPMKAFSPFSSLLGRKWIALYKQVVIVYIKVT